MSVNNKISSTKEVCLFSYQSVMASSFGAAFSSFEGFLENNLEKMSRLSCSSVCAEASSKYLNWTLSAE